MAQKHRKTWKSKRSSSKSKSPKKQTRQKAPEPSPIPEVHVTLPAISERDIDAGTSRLDRIKESHALLQQFNSKELKILMNLKRNTSPKAWTLREDLVVLTLAISNRDIADLLNDRNKEAVKKRLQLLRSKGLAKRLPEAAPKQ